jgi:hypothetical protein
MATASKREKGKLRLDNVLGCYVSVFQAREIPGSQGGPKFSICLLLPKADKQVAQVKAQVEALIVEKFGAGAKVGIGSKYASPLHDGDIERAEDPVFRGVMYLNASAKPQYPPGVVNAQVKKIFEEAECYSGCTFNASLSLYAYDKGGKKGVGVGLNNLQVTKKGPRIDGRKDATEDFAEVGAEESAADVDPIG